MLIDVRGLITSEEVTTSCTREFINNTERNPLGIWSNAQNHESILKEVKTILISKLFGNKI